QGVFRNLQTPWLQANGLAHRVAIRGVVALTKASGTEQQGGTNAFEYRGQLAAALTGRHRYPEQSRLLASQAHQVPLGTIGQPAQNARAARQTEREQPARRMVDPILRFGPGQANAARDEGGCCRPLARM